MDKKFEIVAISYLLYFSISIRCEIKLEGKKETFNEIKEKIKLCTHMYF